MPPCPALQVPDDLDSDDSDYGLPGAVSALALANKAKGRTDSASSRSRIAAVQPAKPKPVQGPVRVRPWPAGPLPSEREEAAKGDKGEAKAPKDKINRQIGLGPMLGELKIKGQRLHNAGVCRHQTRYKQVRPLLLLRACVCGGGGGYGVGVANRQLQSFTQLRTYLRQCF